VQSITEGINEKSKETIKEGLQPAMREKPAVSQKQKKKVPEDS
jgi:hypothetical protein